MSVTEEFYVIWNPAHPDPPSKKYDKENQALAVAGEMARKFPETDFFVLKAIGVARTEKHVTRKFGGDENPVILPGNLSVNPSAQPYAMEFLEALAEVLAHGNPACPRCTGKNCTVNGNGTNGAWFKCNACMHQWKPKK